MMPMVLPQIAPIAPPDAAQALRDVPMQIEMDNVVAPDEQDTSMQEEEERRCGCIPMVLVRRRVPGLGSEPSARDVLLPDGSA